MGGGVSLRVLTVDKNVMVAALCGAMSGSERANETERALLFGVSFAVSRGGRDTTDHTGHNDDGQQIWDHLRKLRRDIRSEDRQERLNGATQAEEERSKQRAQRRPVSDDHRRDADEPQAVGHHRVEDVYRLQGEPGPSQAGEEAAKQDGHVPGAK